MKKNMKTTKRFIKSARRRLGLNQEDFARLIGVARYSVSDYETGRCQPSGALVLRIQEILSKIERGGAE